MWQNKLSQWQLHQEHPSFSVSQTKIAENSLASLIVYCERVMSFIFLHSYEVTGIAFPTAQPFSRYSTLNRLVRALAEEHPTWVVGRLQDLLLSLTTPRGDPRATRRPCATGRVALPIPGVPGHSNRWRAVDLGFRLSEREQECVLCGAAPLQQLWCPALY